jgi:hypothetical protein
VLSLASVYFTKDAQTMVLDPLEGMIEKVNLLANDPLAASSDEVQQAGIYTYAVSTMRNKKDEDKLETTLLDQAIVKIG